MISITEPKIAGLTPRWAPFPGFSLLFDPPGSALRHEGAIESLACDVVGDPALEFYRRMHRGLQSLDPDRLLQSYGLCPLPSASYHVTAYDVANVADLARCRVEARDGLRAMLDRLPAPEAFDEGLLVRAHEFARTEWNLTFGFGEFCHWGGVIAVRLRPQSEEAFGRFVEARAALSQDYRANYGVGAGESYTPHVTLGYFMNPQGAELAVVHRSGWEEAVRSAVGEATITFRTASIYGFTDMATFFRKASV